MNIRIKRITLKGGGPVVSFDAEMRPLTVIYGKNESGKTTLVENILACLFQKRPGKRDTVFTPSLRGTEFIGTASVTVEGITGRPEVFTPGKRRLDEAVIGDTGMIPWGLFNLLFVKGSETEVISEKGGLTRSVIKSLLSQHRALENIKKNLPRELNNTLLEDAGIITGDGRGRYFKLYQESRYSLDELMQLEDEFHSTVSQGQIIRLDNKKKGLLSEKETMLSARNHYAYLISREIEELKKDMSAATEKDLKGLEDSIKVFFRERSRAAEHRKKMDEFTDVEDDIIWIDKARNQFQDHIAGRGGSRLITRMLMGLAVIPVALAGIIYFAAPQAMKPAAMLACSGVSLASFLGYIIYSILQGRKADAVYAGAVVDQIKKSFRERFARELHSVPDFDAVKETLVKSNAVREETAKNLAAMESNLSALEVEIASGFERAAGSVPPQDEWLSAVSDLLEEQSRAQKVIIQKESMLQGLDVDPVDYVREYPGMDFSRKRLGEIDEEIDAAQFELQQERERTAEILEKISSKVGKSLRGETIEGISERIQARKEELAVSIRESLAALVAGICVNSVLEDYLKEEDREIEKDLNDPNITGLIKSFTGRYESLYFNDEEIILTGTTGEYPLRNLSTGAQEQVLLAIRMGIAMKKTGRNCLFMILDDAFQYSDWERRERLVQQSAQMVSQGWQVIYFTMDDDIRDRFDRAGKGLGKGAYRLIELA